MRLYMYVHEGGSFRGPVIVEYVLYPKFGGSAVWLPSTAHDSVAKAMESVGEKSKAFRCWGGDLEDVAVKVVVTKSDAAKRD